MHESHKGSVPRKAFHALRCRNETTHAKARSRPRDRNVAGDEGLMICPQKHREHSIIPSLNRLDAKADSTFFSARTVPKRIHGRHYPSLNPVPKASEPALSLKCEHPA